MIATVIVVVIMEVVAIPVQVLSYLKVHVAVLVVDNVSCSRCSNGSISSSTSISTSDSSSSAAAVMAIVITVIVLESQEVAVLLTVVVVAQQQQQWT